MRKYIFRKEFFILFVSIIFFSTHTVRSQETVKADSSVVRSDTVLVKPDSVSQDTVGIPLTLEPILSIEGVFNDESDIGLIIKETIDPRKLDSLIQNSINEIDFTEGEAIEYITKWYNDVSIWNNPDDPLRKAMGRYLYEATNDQFYVSEWYINAFEWDHIKIPRSNFYLWDTLHFVIPAKDTSISVGKDSSMTLARSDSAALFTDSTRINRQSVRRDSVILVISDTLSEVISTNQFFPFSYYNNPMTGDSIKAAMDVIRSFTHRKDSSKVVFTGSEGSEEIWLSDYPNPMTRLWLINEWGEELSIWIGSPSRDSVSVIVEKGIHFRRPDKETRIADARVGVDKFDHTRLADPKKIDIIPQYWKFFSEASFVFNQAIIKNWTKGGESNISTLIDVSGSANYTNKEKKISWNTIGRFKYGLIMSEGYGGNKYDVRKNIDVLDISSKFSNKAFGKFDFSAMLLFKSQLANGYNYPNDSVVISKFFNPATITVGLGLDYKPNKNTSINFAPLSYKATFVPDTVHIDQTKHGLTADQRSKHEPGMSIQIEHKAELWDIVTLSNEIRLFTNYIHNPLNIDIDWEMIATAKLNWFTDVRLNTHLIYDDDTLIPLTDEDGEPVLGADGNQKKVPKVQFKEIFGISVIFRF